MNRRGLSNIAAALVLILTVLAVASGVYIYTETLSSGGRASGLQILSASITYSGGRAYLEVDVQNTGSVKLTNVVVHMNPAGSTYSTVYTSTSTSGTPGPVRTTNAWYGYVNGPTGSVTQAVNVPQGSNAEAVMMCVSNILWSSPPSCAITTPSGCQAVLSELTQANEVYLEILICKPGQYTLTATETSQNNAWMDFAGVIVSGTYLPNTAGANIYQPSCGQNTCRLIISFTPPSVPKGTPLVAGMMVGTNPNSMFSLSAINGYTLFEAAPPFAFEYGQYNGQTPGFFFEYRYNFAGTWGCVWGAAFNSSYTVSTTTVTSTSAVGSFPVAANIPPGASASVVVPLNATTPGTTYQLWVTAQTPGGLQAATPVVNVQT